MIYVGLTGWRDHPSLYNMATAKNRKLETYAGYFPTVEIDSAYYAVLSPETYRKWIDETPDIFRFVVKAHRSMTGQSETYYPFSDRDELFHSYRRSIQPLVDAGKLGMVLCQFPPWFDCRAEHIKKVRYVKKMLHDVPLAIEFRHQSWYFPKNRNRVIQFLNEQDCIHTVCDEPQAGDGSVPIVNVATSTKKALIRLHGRNIEGWRKETSGENWRAVRYLYNYGENELMEWVRYATALQQEAEDVFIIFNNNSGRHAAGNAQTFMRLADISYDGLAPRQLNLFDWEG
ncbi:DUF72 domain-containing protein [Salicibibacter kimchii]|uniref:DUF72 domain-containing protein n=1 Tax=Salicibibacter kimchii TaxID=2099786 RepID=A0A345BYX9_9BACI|nr:DUF72 domain-containing protein [Salicibibacter kimchii]AXF56160.1 DUF72 domain-containing protein [Salicibibacter kimchii]